MGAQAVLDQAFAAIRLGGPVVAVLLAASLLSLATVLFLLWRFRVAGVGRHGALTRALAAWDRGEREAALGALGRSASHLAPLIGMALGRAGPPPAPDRLAAEAEARLAALERGFRLLDSIAQTAPLLGLFGTVLGMIEAFQAMQSAGAQVDPSALAGGIWVALLTTAVGLAVAMPTAAALSWLEGRMERERVFADLAIAAALAPAIRSLASPAASPAAGPMAALHHGA